MQTRNREHTRSSISAKQYRNVSFVRIFGGVIFIFLLLLIFTSLLPAQVKPIDKIITQIKDVNITIGSPIVNPNTERALKAVDRIPGLKKVINIYNMRYGSDSVHASRFVDREPDEKADDNVVKNYYNVDVVADSAHHQMRWFTFLISKDFNGVLYYDFKNAKTADINDWRKIWPASEFLGTGTTINK
jgi:hypothetical protein